VASSIKQGLHAFSLFWFFFLYFMYRRIMVYAEVYAVPLIRALMRWAPLRIFRRHVQGQRQQQQTAGLQMPGNTLYHATSSSERTRIDPNVKLPPLACSYCVTGNECLVDAGYIE
jgi:hypothetical protein